MKLKVRWGSNFFFLGVGGGGGVGGVGGGGVGGSGVELTSDLWGVWRYL